MDYTFLEIYRKNGAIYGTPTPLEGKSIADIRKDYGRCFKFPGKTICFFLFTSDYTIGRDDALAFATAITEGRTVHHHIDLLPLAHVKEAKIGRRVRR